MHVSRSPLFVAVLAPLTFAIACGSSSTTNPGGPDGVGANSGAPDAAMGIPSSDAAANAGDDAGAITLPPDDGGTGADPDADAGTLGDDGGGAASDAAAPLGSLVVPVTPVWTAGSATKVTVQLSIGGGAPITATVDTGSVGLRILTGAVPPANWDVTTTAVGNYTYGGAITIHGVIAHAMVQLGGVGTPMMVDVEDITSVTCTASHPNCNDSGTVLPNGYVAIMGVGMRAGGPLVSPLIAMTKTSEYIMALPKPMGTTGSIILDPSAAEKARFAGLTQLPAFSGNSTPPAGVHAWDDTQVPFCVNQYCGNGLFDTGGAALVLIRDDSDYAALGVADGATTFDPGTAVAEKAGSTVTWDFTVGDPAVSGIDLFSFGAGAGGNGTTSNVGPAPFYQNDVFYDYAQGQIGFAPKP